MEDQIQTNLEKSENGNNPEENEKYDDVSFIPYGPSWNADKVGLGLWCLVALVAALRTYCVLIMLLQVKTHLLAKLDEMKAKHNKNKIGKNEFSSFFAVGSIEEILGYITTEEEFKKEWGKLLSHKPKWNKSYRK